MTRSRTTRFGSHHPKSTTQVETDKNNPPRRRCGMCDEMFPFNPRGTKPLPDHCPDCLQSEYDIAQETKGERTLEQVREELGWGDVDDGSVELEQDEMWRN